MPVKEFLSCVRELDVRIRCEAMHSLAVSNAGTSNSADAGVGDKSKDQWWLKSNHVSCLNLKRMAELLGPLTNWWDGGGGGERFTQVAKLWIPRGIREGGIVRSCEKVHKMDAMKRIEDEHCSPDTIDLTNNDSELFSSDGTETSDTLESSSVADQQPPVSTVNVMNAEDDEPDSDIKAGEDDDSNELEMEEEERWSTPMEEEQMNKARTHFIYKNVACLQEATDNNKPVSGVLLRAADGGAEMCVLHKRPEKQFGWMTISFQDKAGVSICGLWCAPVVFSDANSPPSSVKQIAKLAKMATVAVPLHCTLGRDHEHSHKFCAMTNWWRERNGDGRCVFSTLAFDLHCDGDQAATTS